MSQMPHDDRANGMFSCKLGCHRNNMEEQYLKAVFFDLFETLITEKTRKDFQVRAPFHERLGTTEDKSSLWWAENENAAMVGRFPDCLARFTDLCVAVDEK